MTALTSLVRSTVGMKVVMAVTGLIMVGWLLIHTTGNMLVFAGQEEFNHYAHFIQSGFGVSPEVLWFMRAFMLGSIVAHIWAAIGLSAKIRQARPVAYAGGRNDRVTNYAARFMLLGGIVVALYVVFHLLHLTVGTFSDDMIQQARFVKRDAYRNLVVGLSNPLVAAFYIIANLALGAHLSHGVWSGMQTLGLDDPKYTKLKSALGYGLPLIIVGGNILIAIAILAGLVPEVNFKWRPGA